MWLPLLHLLMIYFDLDYILHQNMSSVNTKRQIKTKKSGHPRINQSDPNNFKLPLSNSVHTSDTIGNIRFHGLMIHEFHTLYLCAHI